MAGSSKLSAKIDAVRAKAAPHVMRADESIIGRAYNRLLEIEFIDRSIALAAKAFIAFFPFLIAIVTAAPVNLRESISSTIIDRFGLAGESAELVKDTFDTSTGTQAATGIFGLIFLLLYATSFTTALQRIYLRSWRRPPGGGLKNNGRGLAWLAGVVALVSVNGLMGRILTAPITGDFLRVVIAVSTSTAIWWWTAHSMLRGEIRWRPLLPSAVLTGVGVLAYGLSATIWMPRTVANNEAQFGFFGVSLSIVSWFVGVAFVVIIAAAIAPTLSEGHGPFARWLRGPDDTVLTEGAPEPLPGPTTRLRMAAALGIGRDDEDDS